MHPKRPAFVLKELAVALVVLVVLAGLLCHTVQRVYAASERTRTQQRLERPAKTGPAAPVSLTKANHRFAKDR